MTVTTTAVTAGPYTGNGVTTSFPFSFAAASPSEIIVLLDGVAAATSAYAATAGFSGGSVMMNVAPASGVKVTIVSAPTFTQNVVYEDQQAFFPTVANEINDRAVVRDLALLDGINRSVRAPIGEAMPPLPSASVRASKFAGYDASGNPAVFSGISVGGTDTLRQDLAATGGAALVKSANGQTLQQFVDAGATLPLKVASAPNDGTTNASTALAAFIAGGVDGETLAIPAGKYALTAGLVVDSAKVFRLQSFGRVEIIPAAGQVAITVPADLSITPGTRHVQGIEAYSPGYRAINVNGFAAGTVGLRWGSVTPASPGAVQSVINPRTSDAYFHNLDNGLDHFGSQEALDSNVICYRNNIGMRVTADANAGGATAGESFHCTYQYNNVGVFMNNAGRVGVETTATISTGSTTITAVGTTAGISVGLNVRGPGIQGSTVVSSFTSNTITLSKTPTRNQVGSPIFVYSSDGAGFGFGTGWNFDGVCTFQANYVCDLALFGFNGVTIGIGSHFETAAVSGSVTKDGRTIPACSIYLNNSELICNGAIFSQYNASVGIIMENASRLQMRDMQMPSSYPPVTGSPMSRIDFLGTLQAAGHIDVAIGRWPDQLTALPSQTDMIGAPIFVPSRGVTNETSNINPRIPAYSGTTMGYADDPVFGRVLTAQFPASVGSLGGNSISKPFLNGTVNAGETAAEFQYIRADTYTRVTMVADNGGGAIFWQNILVTPFWQRVFVGAPFPATKTGLVSFLYPVAADGPKFYLANEMGVRDLPGLGVPNIAAVMARGLFDDKGANSGFIGTATIDLPSIAAGAAGAEQTITVKGATVGKFVSVGASIDSLGLDFPARVTAVDTVKFIPRNITAGAIDLASATFTARVAP